MKHGDHELDDTIADTSTVTNPNQREFRRDNDALASPEGSIPPELDSLCTTALRPTADRAELASLVRPTEMAGGVLTLRSHAIALEGPAMIFISVATAAVFVILAVLATGTTRTNLRMQRQLLVQRWRLSQLIPSPRAEP